MPNNVQLTEDESTVTSVNASWTIPAGTVDSYSISCSNGTANPSVIQSDGTLEASCTNLPTAGDEYTMTITSISGNQTNDAMINLRACEYMSIS